MACPWCNRVHDGGPEACIAGPVIVCGGRDYADRARVWAVLGKLSERMEIFAIRHGAARGADTLAGEWARERGITEQRFPADWTTHGKAAGHIRNQAMLDTWDPAIPSSRPAVCVAFPGGRGTADMVRRATAAGLRVWNLGGEGVRVGVRV